MFSPISDYPSPSDASVDLAQSFPPVDESALQGEVEHTVCQGWLKKKGAKGMHWQTRYFVLALFEAEDDEPEQALLLYYRSLEHAKEDVKPGVIQLHKVTKVAVNMFAPHRWSKTQVPRILLTVEQRVYELMCPSVEAALAWQGYVGQYLNEGVTFEGSLSPAADVSALASPSAASAGGATKQLQRIQAELERTRAELSKTRAAMAGQQSEFEKTLQVEKAAASQGRSRADTSAAEKRLARDLEAVRAEKAELQAKNDELVEGLRTIESKQ